MFPELFKIGPVSVKTYGVFVAAGFIFALFYLAKRLVKEGFLRETATDFSFYVIISGIIGARILYVMLNWGFYRNNFLDIFSIWSGGLVFYGGFILATITGIVYLRAKKITILRFADFVAPAIFLGMAFGRIGCFFAGCCYGKPCALPWAVTFNNPLTFAARGEPLHPVQIYETLFCAALFGFLDYFNSGRLFKSKFNGEAFFISLALYALWRFFIEFLRGDDRGLKLFGLFPSQFFSVIAMAVSIGAIIYLWQKRPEK